MEVASTLLRPPESSITHTQALIFRLFSSKMCCLYSDECRINSRRHATHRSSRLVDSNLSSNQPISNQHTVALYLCQNSGKVSSAEEAMRFKSKQSLPSLTSSNSSSSLATAAWRCSHLKNYRSNFLSHPTSRSILMLLVVFVMASNGMKRQGDGSPSSPSGGKKDASPHHPHQLSPPPDGMDSSSSSDEEEG